jgi:CheY-like chemotaxis protein
MKLTRLLSRREYVGKKFAWHSKCGQLLCYNAAMTEQILLIDDDALMRRSLSFALERAGYAVAAAASAEEGLARMPELQPQLVLLDIGLPGMDGLDALRQIRRHAETPVIFVTARRRELEQVLGLELGADDYVTKPFDVEVLLARIKAVLRRYHSAEQPVHNASVLTLGDLLIDPRRPHGASRGAHDRVGAPRVRSAARVGATPRPCFFHRRTAHTRLGG